MPFTPEEIEAIEPVPPPFYSGPEIARIRDKAARQEEEGIDADEELRVADAAERLAWGRARYQKLSRPSRAMREFARQEVLCRLYDEKHRRKRGYA